VRLPEGGASLVNEPGSTSARPLVLFVNDVAEVRELYRIPLEDAGYRVAEAADGDEAIQQAEALLPSVIVMDIFMPLLDGLDASRLLKREARTRDIPIVALTARSNANPGPENLFAAYLTKPCLPDEMLAAIRRLVAPAARPLPALPPLPNRPAPRAGRARTRN